MKINDYIKDATSKIFDTRAKKRVEAEITDHILCHKKFNEEIGYDAEKAEEMAVEKMGDGIEIAEQLGTLHNDFYNPVGDIIATIIWFLLLGGTYYLLKEYIFDDIVSIPLTIAGMSIAAAVCFFICFIMLKRNRLQTIIFNTIGALGTGIFIFFCIENVNKLTSGSFEKINNLIFRHQICNADHVKSEAIISITITVFAVLALFAVLTAIIYFIKHSTNHNSLFDNHFKKFAGYFVLAVSLVCIATSGLFITNYFSTKKHLKEEYYSYYNQMLDIAKSCRTFDEVCEYVNSFDDEYRVFIDKNDIVQNISFVKNFVKISIERQESGSYNESVVSNYGLVDNGSALDDTFYNDYSLYFAINYSQYYDNYDHSAIKQLFTTENELDDITRFDMEEHTSNESLEFFKDYAPSMLICKPSQNDKYPGSFEWTFLTGDKYKYSTQFSVTIYPQEYIDIKNTQQKIADIIKANPNADFEQIAALTNTELVPYPVSYEDYRKAVNLLGSFFNPVKEDLIERYNELNQFKISDDLYFTLEGQPYEYIYFSSNTKLEHINIIFIGDSKYHSELYGDDALFKKVNIIGEGCYAKNGLCYSYDTLPYFEKDGTRYTYYTVNEDPGDKSGYIKHYFLINSNGEKYEHDICYIDREGYLFFDIRHTLKAEDSGLTYKDSNGNIYTRAFETSWDENGNLINYSDYKQSQN